MRTIMFAATACVALVGAALAQVEASSSTYFLDVDPARYAGPASQRLVVLLNDEPRSVSLSAQDEICVQLQRSAADGGVISARVRALKPEPHEVVVVKVAGPGISPGTYRSTPWGMLLRVVADRPAPPKTAEPVSTVGAPVCQL